MTPETDNQPNINKTNAVIHLRKHLSAVWIVPAIAILAGLWMAYDTWSQKGPSIILTMDTAEGIEANKTVIKVRDVNVGKITQVRLSQDNQSVELVAQLNAKTESLLKEDTQLWVIKPRFDRGSISGLGTLLSGVYIQLQPGTTGKYKNKFQILSMPPVAGKNVPGLRISLVSKGVKALAAGDPVLFQDFPVGRIETVNLDVNKRAINYQLFIAEKYAKLVTENTRFWNSSGFQFKTGLTGITFRTGTLENMVTGGVSFDIPQDLPPGKPVQNFSTFRLYPDQDSINEYGENRHINYLALFHESVRGLSIGAPIEYRGLRIGTVTAVPYNISGNMKRLLREKSIPVLLRFELNRIENFVGKQTDKVLSDEIVYGIQHGFSARLKTGNLITGAAYIDLDFDDKAKKNQKIATLEGLPIMPTTQGGLTQIESKVTQLLDKLNNLPVEGALQNASNAFANADKLMIKLKDVAKQLKKITADPNTQAIPTNLQKTLNDLQKTLEGYSKEAPVYQDLHKTLKNLNELIRDARPVVQTIQQKPNALIFNRSGKDVQPKGK